jgi:hypothetical protein
MKVVSHLGPGLNFARSAAAETNTRWPNVETPITRELLNRNSSFLYQSKAIDHTYNVRKFEVISLRSFLLFTCLTFVQYTSALHPTQVYQAREI